jgi:hypothetical protein
VILNLFFFYLFLRIYFTIILELNPDWEQKSTGKKILINENDFFFFCKYEITCIKIIKISKIHFCISLSKQFFYFFVHKKKTTSFHLPDYTFQRTFTDWIKFFKPNNVTNNKVIKNNLFYMLVSSNCIAQIINEKKNERNSK